MTPTTFIKKVILRLHLFGWFKFLPDALDIKLLYLVHIGKIPNLKAPETFNEKLNWLKLHHRKPIYTTLVDKYALKEWVSNKVGKQYVIPTLGVWNKFEEIDFDKLPNQFVLKCTHDSAGLVICKDKSKLDIKQIQKKINNCLKRNFFYIAREWPYKNVKPRIIAEKYMEDSGPEENSSSTSEQITDLTLTDYKFFCFNGKPRVMYISKDHANEPFTDYFDMDFNHLNIQTKDPNAKIPPKCPSKFKDMMNLATTLSENIPFVRVDFYCIKGKIYIGEMTFYPNGGFCQAKPIEWESKMGKWIKLPFEK